MPKPSLWEQYAALPINFAAVPKTLEEIRVYRQHLNAKQILATRTNGPTSQDRLIKRRLQWLADLEDKMLAKSHFGKVAA